MHGIHKAVEHYAHLLSAVWSEETANPESRPLPKGKDPSFGQCEVSSSVLLEALHNDFPHEPLGLAYGTVLSAFEVAGRIALRPIIRCHVWIHWGSEAFPVLHSKVVDISAAQAQPTVLPLVVQESYDNLNEQGIAYQPRAFYRNPEQLGNVLRQYGSNFEERLSLLRERFNRLAKR